MGTKEVIPQFLRNGVWNMYTRHGGYCYICGGVLLQQDFAAGHIAAEANDGKVTIDNLRPIHFTCNSSVGTKNMDTVVEKYNLAKIESFIDAKHTQTQKRTRRIIELFFVIRQNLQKILSADKYFRVPISKDTLLALRELDELVHTS
jgi:hypothetical protein